MFSPSASQHDMCIWFCCLHSAQPRMHTRCINCPAFVPVPVNADRAWRPLLNFEAVYVLWHAAQGSLWRGMRATQGLPLAFWPGL